MIHGQQNIKYKTTSETAKCDNWNVINSIYSFKPEIYVYRKTKTSCFLSKQAPNIIAHS
jgi:hypothetical protein